MPDSYFRTVIPKLKAVDLGDGTFGLAVSVKDAASGLLGSLGATCWVVASNAKAEIKAFAQVLQAAGYPVWVCDGTADNVEIQATLDAITAGIGGRVILSEGVFNITAPVNITRGGTSLEGQGMSSQINWVGDHAGITATGIQSVYIRNLYLHGPGQANVAAHGISLDNISWVLLDSLFIEHCRDTIHLVSGSWNHHYNWINGVDCYNGVAADPAIVSMNFEITNSWLECSHYGFDIYQWEGPVIQNVTVFSAQYGLYAHSLNGGVLFLNQVIFDNNSVVGIYLVPDGGEAVGGVYCTQVTTTGQAGATSIYADGAPYLHFANCRLQGGLDAVTFRNSTNLRIIGSSIEPGTAGTHKHGVTLYIAQDVTIEGCHFGSWADYCIYCTNNTYRNIFKGNNYLAADHGVVLRAGWGLLDSVDIIERSIKLDLSGGAVDIETFHATCACQLVGYKIVYTEAASGDAGVNIRVGRYASGVALDDDYFDITVSTPGAGLGFSDYIDTLALTQLTIAAGDTVTVGTAGGKVGIGEVMLVLQIAEMAD